MGTLNTPTDQGSTLIFVLAPQSSNMGPWHAADVCVCVQYVCMYICMFWVPQMRPSSHHAWTVHDINAAEMLNNPKEQNQQFLQEQRPFLVHIWKRNQT